jgi:hypothetical protein
MIESYILLVQKRNAPAHVTRRWSWTAINIEKFPLSFN